MKRGFLTIYAGENAAALRALSVPARVDMLRLLCSKGPLNVNEIARALELPQSTVATGIMILEEAGLVETKAAKARKGYQKICSALYDEILPELRGRGLEARRRCDRSCDADRSLYKLREPCTLRPLLDRRGDPDCSTFRTISLIRSACRPVFSGLGEVT